MSEMEDRLIRCFASVFPGLSPEQIRATSASSTGEWDSFSMVTLAAVIQQEFCIQIDPQLLPDLNSFEAFWDLLRSLSSNSESLKP